MTEGANAWIEMELATLYPSGARVVRQLKDLTEKGVLNKAAERILLDSFEAAKEDVLRELPKPRVKADIWNTKSGNYFTVEVKGRNFTRVYHIPKERAIYYYGSFEIKGFYVYIRVEAVYSPALRTTFYRIALDNNMVKATAEDLSKMLEGEE
jgi:Holliday junction resolvase